MGFLTGLRVHPSKHDDALWKYFSHSTPTYTGKYISEEETLTSSAVWAAVTILSQTVAMLPLILYKRLKPRGKERCQSHPLYDIMHLRPNPEMTSMEYREAQMGQNLVFGRCFADIERDQNGNVKAIWPLLSRNMEKIERVGNRLMFYYKLPDGSMRPLKQENVLYVNGFSTQGLLGAINPVKTNKEAIALGLALEEYGARFFGNDATPPTVLEHPETISKEAQDKLKGQWEQAYRGLENKHRVAILEEGMKLHVFGVTPADSQAIESRKFQITEVARIFNMPPHMLKDLDRASFNNIEMMSLEFVIYTLMPWLTRFEQAYTVRLLSEAEQKNLFFEHLVDGLLRGDIATRTTAYANGIQWGYWSRNDVREMENQNPQPGLDEYLVPLNMIPASQVGLTNNNNGDNNNQNDNNNNDEGSKEENKSLELSVEKRSVIARDRIQHQYYPLFRQAAQRVINREALAVNREVEKELNNRGRVDLRRWLDDFYQKMPEYIKQEFGPLFRSFFEAIAKQSMDDIGAIVENKDLQAFVTDYIETYAQRHSGSSYRQLLALFEDPQGIEGMSERVNEWQDKRPDKIATNETTRGSNAVAQFVWWSVGYATFWRTRGPQTCPYCLELEGRSVRPQQNFLEHGDRLEPQNTGQVLKPMKIKGIRKHPPLHAGCDCYLSIR